MIFWSVLAAVATATPAPATPPPPATLRPYIVDGMPDPDRPGWLRGTFPGASPAQKAEWMAFQAWLGRCFDAGTAHAAGEIAASGAAKPVFGNGSYPPPLCAAFASLTPPRALQQLDWHVFLEVNEKAKATFDVLFYGAKLGAESSPFDPS